MSKNDEVMMEMIKRFQPRLELPEVVFRINQIYHDFEAAQYDRRHPEIVEQLPAVWSLMMDRVQMKSNVSEFQVLDFGCGTGFASEQLLKSSELGAAAVSLICYDPSAGMLKEAQERLSTYAVSALFTSDIDEVMSRSYDMIVSNAVLHHLSNPIEQMKSLATTLVIGGYWLAGHEPSARFYLNPDCSAVLNRYRAQHRRSRWVNPTKYVRKGKRLLGLELDLAREVSKASVVQGVFATEPSKSAVSRLVDYYVAHSKEEAESARGFDFKEMETALVHSLKLEYVHTYSFMGDTYEGKLPRKWRQEASRLAGQYPNDGASFSSVWLKEAK